MTQRRRPGHLTAYARHAGISKPAAAEQLRRVGIDYMQPFDFDDADRKRAAARHADRAQYAKTIYVDQEEPVADPEDEGPAPKNPVYAEIQARKEHYKAELARLEFEQAIGKLVDKERTEHEAFRVARLVRDAMLNISARLEGPIAAETDQRKVREMLDREIRQALEALSMDETGGTAAA